MPVNHSVYTLAAICSSISVETTETYQESISRYQDQDEKYIVMPFDMKYYDITEESLNDLSDEQIVGVNSAQIETLELLIDHPFILTVFRPSNYYFKPGMELEGVDLETDEIVDYFEQDSNTRNEGEFYRVTLAGTSKPCVEPRKFVELYPEHKEDVLRLEEGIRWSIVTLSHANKRGVDEMLYAVLSAFERKLSDKISDHYPDSNNLSDTVRSNTASRWRDDRGSGLDLHITEYMYLNTMIDIVSQSEPILDELGCSADEFEKKTENVSQLRNKVMHPTKTLARNQTELEIALEKINNLEGIIIQSS